MVVALIVICIIAFILLLLNISKDNKINKLKNDIEYITISIQKVIESEAERENESRE